MSGEPTEIILAADPSGAMANLLGHLGEVDRAGLTDWALIGGLAVSTSPMAGGVAAE